MDKEDEKFITTAFNNVMDVLEKVHAWMGETDSRLKKLEDNERRRSNNEDA